MGTIYKTTWWGYVCDSTNGWGSSYKAIANCETPQQIQFDNRVTTDGGIIESLNCIAL